MIEEAFRVLKPGGRFAVSDVVVRGEVPDEVKRNMELWIGCVAGALEESEYGRLLSDAGFTDVDIEPTRIYRVEDATAFLTGSGLDVAKLSSEIEGRFMSAFVRATKPATCCGPNCYAMRYALISDIHANLPALTAVLDQIALNPGIDATYHLGDLVGYGSSPNETVDLLIESKIVGIAGNYDSTVATDAHRTVAASMRIRARKSCRT